MIIKSKTSMKKYMSKKTNNYGLKSGYRFIDIFDFKVPRSL